MFDALEQHLKRAASPEIETIVTEAFVMFDRFDVSDYETGFVDLMMNDNIDQSDLNNNILGLICEIQDQVLKSFRIQLNEDATAKVGNQVLFYISLLEDIEPTKADEIYQILNDIVDPVDAFVDIIEAIGGESAESYRPMIAEVDDATLNVIRELMAKQLDNADKPVIDLAAVRAAVARIRSFGEFVTPEPLMIYQKISEGQMVGLPYAEYHAALMPQLMSAEPARIAKQLYAASLAACDTQTGDVRRPIQVELNKSFSSVDIITPIVVALESLILRFRNHETSGVNKVQ